MPKIFNEISAFLTFLILISNFLIMLGLWYEKLKTPEKSQNDRITTLEKQVRDIMEHFSSDDDRLALLEDGNVITQRAILAIMGHELNGNDVENLKQAKNDLERYLKLISQSINSSIDIVIDKELVKKVEEIIDLRLSNGNNGLNENGLHSTIVSIPFSLEGIIDKLKQYDKIAIDYINALKEFNSNAVLFGVLSNSFTMLIQSKSSLYHAMITKCNYGPNVRFEDHKRTNSVQGIPSQFAQQIMPPLQKENAALKSQLRSLTMKCDQLSKENFILKQKMRTNTSSGNTNNNDISNIDLSLWSPQKRESLSTPKSNQNSPECIHNDINFVDQNATNNNNDFTKCLTYSQNNTSMANNITKHNYICSSTSDLVKQRRKTET